MLNILLIALFGLLAKVARLEIRRKATPHHEVRRTRS